MSYKNSYNLIEYKICRLPNECDAIARTRKFEIL